MKHFFNATWFVALILLVGCERRSGLPDQSYTFPTAILGIVVGSPAEGEQIKGALASFASEFRLQRYRAIESPFFSEQNRREPWSHVERGTDYNPPPGFEREGFSIHLEEFSPKCFVVSLSERSGIWTQRSLEAVRELQRLLSELTEDRTRLLVRPKEEQNWPMQNGFSDPERPTYLAELCVRMGLPDPRSPEEARRQGPFAPSVTSPNKAMEPTR
jgi:hypothetical protein